MNGLTRGLQLMADYLALLVKIVPKRPDALPDFLAVARVWLADTVNIEGQVVINPWKLVNPFVSYDPWKPSRAAFRALRAKYTMPEDANGRRHP